jgi:sirohydrochlorin cobaltochelatase
MSVILQVSKDSVAVRQEPLLREFCQSLSNVINEPVILRIERDPDAPVVEEPAVDECTPDPAAPMAAAPFVYLEDGRPDWGTMWQSFCELALYGGPPHRGPDDPVLEPTVDDALDTGSESLEEIRRGIFETTGLQAEPSPPHWMAVRCESRRMAAWMCAAIILENVDARCEDETLYVPASPTFELKNEVKSVITVIAKVHHYWQAHVEEQAARGIAI